MASSDSLELALVQLLDHWRLGRAGRDLLAACLAQNMLLQQFQLTVPSLLLVLHIYRLCGSRLRQVDDEGLETNGIVAALKRAPRFGEVGQNAALAFLSDRVG